MLLENVSKRDLGAKHLKKKNVALSGIPLMLVARQARTSLTKNQHFRVKPVLWAGKDAEQNTEKQGCKIDVLRWVQFRGSK